MGKPRKHKRKGPKSTRSGCLFCKPHKHQNADIPNKQYLVNAEKERNELADSKSNS
jgi:hypothetical protein